MGGAALRKLLDLLARAKAFVEPCCSPGRHCSLTKVWRQSQLSMTCRLSVLCCLNVVLQNM